MRVIDFHSHLGDVLHKNGGTIIDKRGVQKKILVDLISVGEAFNHSFVGSGWVYKMLGSQFVRAERARNATATLENFEQSMRETNIEQSVCLPIPPYLTFGDLHHTIPQNKGIIPFTGVDFTRQYDVESVLTQDVQAGARGMKLHPILQCEKLTSRKTFDAVEAFAPHALPILLHTGISYYYAPKSDKSNREQPLNGNIQDVLTLVKAFPDVRFSSL